MDEKRNVNGYGVDWQSVVPWRSLPPVGSCRGGVAANGHLRAQDAVPPVSNPLRAQSLPATSNLLGAEEAPPPTSSALADRQLAFPPSCPCGAAAWPS